MRMAQQPKPEMVVMERGTRRNYVPRAKYETLKRDLAMSHGRHSTGIYRRLGVSCSKLPLGSVTASFAFIIVER